MIFGDFQKLSSNRHKGKKGDKKVVLYDWVVGVFREFYEIFE